MPTLEIVSGFDLCGKDRTRLQAFTDSSACLLLHSEFSAPSDLTLSYLTQTARGKVPKCGAATLKAQIEYSMTKTVSWDFDCPSWTLTGFGFKDRSLTSWWDHCGSQGGNSGSRAWDHEGVYGRRFSRNIQRCAFRGESYYFGVVGRVAAGKWSDGMVPLCALQDGLWGFHHISCSTPIWFRFMFVGGQK